MNSRAEEEQHKIRARKQCFHPIASWSAHTSFRRGCPLFYLSPTPIITHQSTKMFLLDPPNWEFDCESDWS